MQIINITGGFDPTKYKMFGSFGSFTPTQANVYETAFEVNGKGWLDLCTIVSSSAIKYLKIIVDGETVYNANSGTTTQKTIGVSVETYAMSNSTTLATQGMNTGANGFLPLAGGHDKLPLIDEVGLKSVIMRNPLYFKSNLKIQLKLPVVAGTAITITGAVKA